MNIEISCLSEQFELLETNFLPFAKELFMDIQAEKLRLIQWLAELNDVEILGEIISLRKAKDIDWWDKLSNEERSEIEIGISQADKGEVISHTEAMAKYKKWL